jgi:hypothetical protein
MTESERYGHITELGPGRKPSMQRPRWGESWSPSLEFRIQDSQTVSGWVSGNEFHHVTKSLFTCLWFVTAPQWSLSLSGMLQDPKSPCTCLDLWLAPCLPPWGWSSLSKNDNSRAKFKVKSQCLPWNVQSLTIQLVSLVHELLFL